MRSHNFALRRAVALLFGLAAAAVVFVAPVLYGQAQPFKVLVYSEIPAAQPYHRDSIPAGVAAIQQLGQQNSFTVETRLNLNTTGTTDTVLTDQLLEQFDVVVFLSPNGNQLNDAEKAAFQRYIEAGGGFVAVHGAMSFERSWGWYRQLLGANFGNHTSGPNGNEPPIAVATVNLATAGHPATEGLPASWERYDEWYNLRYNQTGLQPPITVTTTPLITVDESTYDGDSGMGLHPVSWYQLYDGGRSFVTTMGHTVGSYSEPEFLKHLLGGIMWAAGRTAVPPTPSASATPTTSPGAPPPTPMPKLFVPVAQR